MLINSHCFVNSSWNGSDIVVFQIFEALMHSSLLLTDECIFNSHQVDALSNHQLDGLQIAKIRSVNKQPLFIKFISGVDCIVVFNFELLLTTSADAMSHLRIRNRVDVLSTISLTAAVRKSSVINSHCFSRIHCGMDCTLLYSLFEALITTRLLLTR
ncbi:hypothetical protein AVEN_28743-1 [Araneus ventricosus]|uniref:Uncharacterized protein n=1 Tax=Araneus ventricosus TaxID=182803 RepID=A0A4Y2SX19_ARAVE|nr:hypothetical protein AVEN_28743-1 [Araneus ventricosus]